MAAESNEVPPEVEQGGEAPAKDPQDALDPGIVPNRWELFVVGYPKCSCCLFFWITILLAFATTRMMAGGDDAKLKFEVRSVWDVRDHEVVTQRDAFLQSLQDSGQKLMCDEGGGPPKPCKKDEPARNYTERARKMAMMDIIYEATDDGENVLTQKNFELMREFESTLGNMGMYKDNCQLVDKMDVKFGPNGQMINSPGIGTDGRQCSAAQSLANDIFVDPVAHESLMTQKCFTTQPVCKAGATGAFCVQSNTMQSVPCINCGAGGTPFGTAPCRSSTQAPLPTTSGGLDDLCNALELAGAAKLSAQPEKTKAYYEQQANKLLPRKFDCTTKKVKYMRSFMAFGAPRKGHTQFVGKDKEDQEDDFTKWFVKDLYPEVEKLRKDIEKKSDGKLKVYPICVPALNSLFNLIFMSDGLLAMGSLLFVLFWIWTATGSFFLALCGIFECVLSLILAMLTFSAISKYIGFLSVMMIFVIIGIGADDIFVFLDAFKQSAYQPQLRGDLTLRFAWAWRRSASAMFVTTATTAVSFLAAGFSDVPTVSAFGFFAAFTVIWDYILVITFFASATVIYHNYLEGKKGGHMCMDYKCCCCRLLTPKSENRSSIRAYRPLIILVSILVVMGAAVCTAGSVGQMPFVPMLGAIMICVAAICLQAVINMPDDPTKPRILEAWFSTTFHSFLARHNKKIVGVWTVIFIACTVVVAAVFRPAEDAPKFLSEDHPIMKFIDISAEFQADGEGALILNTVFGIKKDDAFDRTGIDAQTPSGEYLGKVRYSAAAAAAAATPAGQQSILSFCKALRDSDLVVKDPSCNTAFHAKTNPTFKLPTLGTEVGHCRTGVYCFMSHVEDFLTAHCKQCTIGVTSGCNPSSNFTACTDSSGAAITPTFPAPDLHKVLQSKSFLEYMASLPEARYLAGHGHENKIADAMSGFKHNVGGWVGWTGANYSMPKRSSYKIKKEWFDKTKAFVEANTVGMPDAFGSCSRYNWMVTENALFRNTIQAFVFAVLFAWGMLVITGWNWWTGTLGFCSVVVICVVSIAIMVAMGWELGVIESIAIITVVGVSVDYSVHLMHAYGESQAETPSERVRAALMTMGISLIGGVATTLGAALFLWFAQIQFFTQFGKFLGMTVLVSIFVALTFLMPVVMLIGPTPQQGRLCNIFCCVPKGKEGKASDTE